MLRTYCRGICATQVPFGQTGRCLDKDYLPGPVIPHLFAFKFVAVVGVFELPLSCVAFVAIHGNEDVGVGAAAKLIASEHAHSVLNLCGVDGKHVSIVLQAVCVCSCVYVRTHTRVFL